MILNFTFLRKVNFANIHFIKKAAIVLPFTVLLFPLVWLRGGFKSIYLDYDMARDLHELSNIWIGKIVWLGPDLSANFHITPFFFYMFYPALWISGGNARAVTIFNIILSTTALLWLSWLAVKKGKRVLLLVVTAIALTPYWQKIATHPGNGDTYAIFLLATLTSLWFKKAFWLSLLFFGIALAFHPGAIFVLPILLYEWRLKKQNRLKNLFFFIACLIIPWLPIIVFQIITKGYWLRQLLTKPSLGMKIGLNIENLLQITNLLGLKTFGPLVFILWLVITFSGTKRLKAWSIIGLLGVVFFTIISTVPSHYLFGITTLIFFITLLGLTSKKWGSVILLIISTILIINTIKNPPQLAKRSIPILEHNVDVLIQTGQINKEQKLAILTVITETPFVPQSNDYRFFLRIRGYQVLNVPEYSQADTLIMFIEYPDFDWRKWRSWELDQFGEKKLRFEMATGQTKILVFDKKISK